MPVRSKKPKLPEERPSEYERILGTDILKHAVLRNRLGLLVGQGCSLGEFFTFIPTACFTCRRVMPVERLKIGVDLFIRCIDREDCRHSLGFDVVDSEDVALPPAAAPPESTASEVRKKTKYKSKGKK